MMVGIETFRTVVSSTTMNAAMRTMTSESQRARSDAGTFGSVRGLMVIEKLPVEPAKWQPCHMAVSVTSARNSGTVEEW